MDFISRTTVILLLVTFASAQAVSAHEDHPKALAALQQTFLMHCADDLARTISYTEETVSMLQENSNETPSVESAITDAERLVLLDFYSRHLSWLKQSAIAFDQEIEAVFAHQPSGTSWVRSHEALVAGFAEFAGEIDARKVFQRAEIDRRVERNKNLQTAVKERRLLIDPDNMELVLVLWPDNTPLWSEPINGEPVYQPLTDAEVEQLEGMLALTNEEMKGFYLLDELEAYESDWFIFKIEEYTKALEVARSLSRNDVKTLYNALQDEYAICESKSAMFNVAARQVDSIITRNEQSTTPTFQELSYVQRHFLVLKSRFENHSAWLSLEMDYYNVEVRKFGRH